MNKLPKGIACYKFGASDERFEHLRANQLLMWHADLLRREGAGHLISTAQTALTEDWPSTRAGGAPTRCRFSICKCPRSENPRF